MSGRLSNPPRRIAWGFAAVVLTAAGIAVAQPAPPPFPPASAPADPSQVPLVEEAPPAVVAPPPPAPLPPIEEEAEAPASAAPPPKAEAEKPPEPPPKRARYDVAVLQALDKVTAETMRFEAVVGRPVRYKTLVFTLRACERSTADEPLEDSIAYMTIESQPKTAPGKPTPPPRQAFKGWMYASSPGLNPLEHPVYDAWLITCRASAPS